jgi:alpha-galactosidase
VARTLFIGVLFYQGAAIAQTVVSPVPAEIVSRYGLDVSWYAKYVDAWGVPVLGPRTLSDAALLRARTQIGVLLGPSPVPLVAELNRRNIRVVLVARGERMSAIPEVYSRVRTDMDKRYWGGFGATLELPISAGTEANLMDNVNHENVFVHEVGHTVMEMALILADPAFSGELQRAYDRARARGLWSNTYAATNLNEYWAEGVQSYFSVNKEGPKGGDGVHNNVNTREELAAYDRPLYALLNRIYRGEHLESAATAATPAIHSALLGRWIFTDVPSFPGLRMMQIDSEAGQLSGTLTTDWYGPMPMRNLTVENGVASFDIHNGNPRVPVKRWTATLQGESLRVQGAIWYATVDSPARRGTDDEAAQREFKLAPLPPFSPIPIDGLAQTPPMGWSSWNTFAEKIDDATVRQIADAMVATGLRDAGYIYVNIDDGWQGTRDSDGSIRPNERFPDMKALADALHSRGLKLGLYSSPGPKTCAGYEGSYGHVEQDAATFAAWGIDYLKYDLCSGEGFYSTRDQIQRVYRQMGAALKASGRSILYSLCEYGREDVGSWGREVGGHLWRTTGDITDEYKVMANIGFERNGKPEFAGPGGWNDPDMLEVGNGGMSEEEYRTHLTLWALSAGPLLMGHDVRSMSKQTLALLTNREVIAVDQDALGKQGSAVRKDADSEIWVKPLADGSAAIALFNRTDAPRSIEINAADIGFKKISGARDLWTHKSLSPSRRRFEVPAHGTVMLKISGSLRTDK